MQEIRSSIVQQQFVSFMRQTLDFHFEQPTRYPSFVQACLRRLGLQLL